MWNFTGDGNLTTAPVVVNNTVLIGSSSGKVYGVDAGSGFQVWMGVSPKPINGDSENRIAGNLNVSFVGIDSETLIAALKDLAVSSGSACNTATNVSIASRNTTSPSRAPSATCDAACPGASSNDRETPAVGVAS